MAERRGPARYCRQRQEAGAADLWGEATMSGRGEHGPPSPPGYRVPSVGSSLQGPSWPRRQVRPPPAAPCTPGLSLEVKVKLREDLGY